MIDTKAKYFIAKPLRIQSSTDNGFAVYLGPDELKMLWSGKSELPEIGDHIDVRMNSIGKAIVRGYFTEWGGGTNWYVGVMALPLDPPDYYQIQNKAIQNNKKFPQWMRDGVGCFYGSELGA